MHIVFASLGSLGDLHPLLALARGLANQGHQISIAASEVYHDHVRDQGFEFCRIRPDFPRDPDLIEYLSHPRHGPKRLMTEHIFAEVQTTYHDLLQATESADFLVVGELLYVAPLVARERNIRWANIILAPTSLLSVWDPCELAPLPWFIHTRFLGRWPHQVVFAIGRKITAGWERPLRELQQKLGLTDRRSAIFDAKHSPDLVLALFPTTFAAQQPDWPASTIQTGFPFFQQTPQEESDLARLREFLDAGPPPVLLTLGSSVVHFATSTYVAAMAAVFAAGQRIVVLGGPDLPGHIDKNVAIRFDYAPLGPILAGVSLVIHQGGIGMCAQTLRAGIPSLIIPFGYDQPDNARRMSQLGVSITVPKRRSSSSMIQKQVKRILSNPRFQTSAKSHQSTIHADSDMDASLRAIMNAASKPIKKMTA